MMDLVADPEVREALALTTENVVTGNWLGAIWGIGATVAAVASHKTYKHVKRKRDATREPPGPT